MSGACGVIRDPIFGCLLVQSRLDRDGYAYHGKSRAHIVAWVAANGPVLDGHHIDHACQRRNCKAPQHLEAVTQSENEKRKSFAYRLKRTHCARGHDLNLHRQITPERGVVCRMCSKEQGAVE